MGRVASNRFIYVCKTFSAAVTVGLLLDALAAQVELVNSQCHDLERVHHYAASGSSLAEAAL